MRLTWINGAFPRGRRIPGDLPGCGLGVQRAIGVLRELEEANRLDVRHRGLSIALTLNASNLRHRHAGTAWSPPGGSLDAQIELLITR